MRSVSRPKEKATRPSSLARISMPSALSVFRLMAGPMRSGLMSQLGLGRVKTDREGRRYREQKAEWVSGRDRSDQRLDPDDVHDPCQIVGQDRECHFSAYFWKRWWGQTVAGPELGPFDRSRASPADASNRPRRACPAWVPVNIWCLYTLTRWPSTFQSCIVGSTGRISSHSRLLARAPRPCSRSVSSAITTIGRSTWSQ